MSDRPEAERMSDDQALALRELLRRETQAAGAEAIRSGGELAPERVERLQRLARLIEIDRETRPPIRQQRWPIAATAVVTLMIASALLFLRVPETDIELDVHVSEAGFALPSRQTLLRSTSLAALGVSGLRELQLPGDGRHDARVLPSTSGDAAADALAFRLASDSAGSRRGTIDLAAITLPAASRIRLRSGDVAHQYRLSFTTPGDSVGALTAHVMGPVSVAATGVAGDRLDLAAPRGVVLVPDSIDVDLDLTFGTSVASPFSSQLSATNLSLQRIEETVDGDRTIVRGLSTILSGTLYFESLDGKPRPLRPGERLTFAQSRGSIRALELREDEITLKFAGRVRGMTTGYGDGTRSIMPTWLEWLKARHGISLLWGTTLYLFGFVLTVARWWKGQK